MTDLAQTTPAASYLKMLYKYPQAEFPCTDLIVVNAARGKSDPEYELLDTGVFDENRYFDVVIEYAKATPEDLLEGAEPGPDRHGGRRPADRGSAMTGWPDQPVIYEINTAVWLGELARAAGLPVTLAGVGAADWDAVVPAGVDAVWLMGMWERSPAGLALANANAELQASFTDALPDLRHTDVLGSPYCVRRYVVDADFGGPDALAVARAALAARGARLILDYVPNHVAPDHPWVTSRPELFVHGHADEPRIASCLPGDAGRAAAVAIATLPGATMWHEGQFEGRRVHPPVFLSRRPDEAPDIELASWYRRLLTAVDSHQVRAGAWRLLEASGWPDNQSCANLAAWSWAGDRGGDRHMVVVNLSGQPAQARIPLDWPDLPDRNWQITDILGQNVFDRDGGELASPGLFVDLGPWQFHLLALQ